MSIFKDTIRPFVVDQLEARKRIISQYGDTGKKDEKGNPIYSVGMVPRADDFLRYVAGKNSWVRMSSFVDCYDEVVKDGKPYNRGVTIGSNTYYGSELARKYILEGGTLYEIDGKFTLRSGVARERGVYASNIDLGGTVKDGSYRPFGYRPMPGITSVEISTKSAYGSLREATIKFYCWDKHQLEELELLYMRTGYTVLLEWGWSQYLKSGNIDGNKYRSDLSNIRIENFDKPTIDIFNPKNNAILHPPADMTSDEVIYDKIDNLQIQHYGNYDAMLGHVKNFSWNLLPNGGFECSTVLISRGEIITGLKLNSNDIGLNKSTPNSGAPPLSLFEQVFLNRAASINSSEITTNVPNKVVGQFASGSNITSDSVTNFNTDLTTRLSNSKNLKTYNGSAPAIGAGYILQTDGFDGIGIEYISMSEFILLLNLYFNIKNNKGNIISQIIIPEGTPCLASRDSVSIDAGVCLIKNSKAEFITGKTGEGFNPQVATSVTIDTNGNRTPPTISSLPEFLIKDNLGDIGKIYIAIPKIIEVYRSTGDGDTDTLLVPFLKNLLTQVSKALGGINDFQLHTTKSTVQIIDVKYLEQTGNKKYQFDLIGLNSICRDVKITSRIFESQSTMIAVGAGARTNIGDVYSSTQNYLNKGLKDRIIPEKLIEAGKDPIDTAKEIFNNLVTLGDYLASKCSGFIINSGVGPQILYPTTAETTNASSLLKSLHYRFNKETDFKAIIPFELEITLDGISGLTVGQVFTINKNLLPQTYANRNVGFIITGISNSLQNNDWTTKIKTQCCLLDNDKIPRIDEVDKTAFKFLEAAKKQREINVILWSALADYMTEMYDAFQAFGRTKGYDVTFTPDPNIAKALYTIPIGSSNAILAGVNKEGGQPSILNYNIPDLFNPDFETYYAKWAVKAKAKYPSENIPETFDKAKVITDINGVLVPLNIFPWRFNEFISYPIMYNPAGKGADFSGQPIYYKRDFQTRDCFIFRDPTFINTLKNDGNKYYMSYGLNDTGIDTGTQAIKNLDYSFLPNSLLTATLSQVNSKNSNEYSYRGKVDVGTPRDDKSVICASIYAYIIQEANGYWSTIDPQYRPSAAMTQFSIYAK